MLAHDAVGTTDEVPSRAELSSKEEDPAELEERLLRRFLNSRRNRALRNLEVKEEALPVPQLVDTLEAEATRQKTIYHFYSRVILVNVLGILHLYYFYDRLFVYPII